MEGLTAFRLIAAILFASLAFQRVPTLLLGGLYCFAALTDLVDGYAARRLDFHTHLGQVFDLVGDKSLTIISLLYASARGVSILPLALLATRDVISIGARIISLDGVPLLPTNRLFGGAIAAITWGTTLVLVVSPGAQRVVTHAALSYWAAAAAVAVNMAWRIHASLPKIKAALHEAREREPERPSKASSPGRSKMA